MIIIMAYNIIIKIAFCKYFYHQSASYSMPRNFRFVAALGADFERARIQPNTSPREPRVCFVNPASSATFFATLIDYGTHYINLCINRKNVEQMQSVFLMAPCDSGIANTYSQPAVSKSVRQWRLDLVASGPSSSGRICYGSSEAGFGSYWT